MTHRNVDPTVTRRSDVGTLAPSDLISKFRPKSACTSKKGAAKQSMRPFLQFTLPGHGHRASLCSAKHNATTPRLMVFKW